MLNLSQEVLDAINGDHDFCHLIDMDLNGIQVRLTEAMFNVNYNGDEYLGNGVLLDIDGARETDEVSVNSTSITFTAAEQSIVAIMLQNNQIERAVKIYRCYLDDDGNPIGAILLTWGTTTSFVISDDVDDTNIQIDIAGPFSDWEKAAGRNTTDGSMRRFFPNDPSMEFASQVKPELEWGA